MGVGQCKDKIVRLPHSSFKFRNEGFSIIIWWEGWSGFFLSHLQIFMLAGSGFITSIPTLFCPKICTPKHCYRPV